MASTTRPDNVAGFLRNIRNALEDRQIHSLVPGVLIVIIVIIIVIQQWGPMLLTLHVLLCLLSPEVLLLLGSRLFLGGVLSTPEVRKVEPGSE